MRSWFYTFAVALGFTTLYCDSLLAYSGSTAFHWSGTPSSLYLAGVVDFLFLCLVLASLLYLLREHRRVRNLVWAAMVIFTPALVVEKQMYSDRMSLSARQHHLLNLACLVVWLLVVTVFSRTFARYAEKIMLVYAFYAAGGVILLSHAAWCGWLARNLNPPFHDQPSSFSLPGQEHPHRVIWIVMDELPYQFIFERRPAGLSLPAFDALTRTATIFTDATPPVAWTEFATSAYLTSVPVTSLSMRLDGSYHLHTAEAESDIAFDEHHTVFQDARDAGYSTAVAGWFMPYCRLMPDVLHRCYWTFAEPLEDGMSPAAGFSGNLAAPFLFAAPHLLPAMVGTRLHVPSNRYRRVAYHIQDYNRLHQAAESLLRDPSLGFVYLHLPVPHNPSIYDRSSGTLQYVPTNDFFNNLALADRCFGELRAVLEQTHQWDDTTVLLMGDHGWRGEAPQGIHDPAAFHDPRQAYIVKLAGQTAAHTLNTPYAAIRTRALLRTIMQQKIKTVPDLDAWARSSP